VKLISPDRAALRDLVARPAGVAELRRSLGVETAARRWLIGGVLPLWLGAGLADWYRHKQTGIEETAGARESMIHALMMTEAGIPVVLGLFCEVNSGVLAACAGNLALHSLTAYWDVSYAEQRRRVTPVEQHIHSVLEMAPVMATGCLAVLYWDQARALFRKPDLSIRAKHRDPLTPRSRLLLLGAMGLFGLLPYAEELLRCLRRKPTLKPLPEAAP
jgi:hypothetical protein